MMMAQKQWSVTRALALLSVLCATVLAAPAVPFQRTTLKQRIRFANGNDTVSVRGVLRRGTDHQYIFKAREGQKLFVRLLVPKGRAGFLIYDTGTPNLEEDLGLDGTGGVTEWHGTLPRSKTGDYTIRVDPNGRADSVRYTLLVTLTWPS
jgi:hypothetical protein